MICMACHPYRGPPMHVSATRGVDYLGNRVVPSTNDRGAIDCSLDGACGKQLLGPR
jgi:hypothetical protein